MVHRGGIKCLFLSVLIMGCHGSEPVTPTGKVAGKVTVKGQPVTAGTVNFDLKAGGYGTSAKLEATGSFSFSDGIPVGVYTVSVSPPEEMPVGPGETPKPRTPFHVPEKYRSAPTSDLTAEVKAGDNPPLTLDLKP